MWKADKKAKYLNTFCNGFKKYFIILPFVPISISDPVLWTVLSSSVRESRTVPDTRGSIWAGSERRSKTNSLRSSTREQENSGLTTRPEKQGSQDQINNHERTGESASLFSLKQLYLLIHWETAPQKKDKPHLVQGDEWAYVKVLQNLALKYINCQRHYNSNSDRWSGLGQDTDISALKEQRGKCAHFTFSCRRRNRSSKRTVSRDSPRTRGEKN